MTNNELLLINAVLEKIVFDGDPFLFTEKLLESFTARQQELLMREIKVNLELLNCPKEYVRWLNYWNVPDCERLDVIRKKLLRENNIDLGPDDIALPVVS
jgi:hypothetical protein